MIDEAPQELLQEIYLIDELNQEKNFDFSLAVSLVKVKQDKDPDLQEWVWIEKHKKQFWAMTFGDFQVHTLDKKV